MKMERQFKKGNKNWTARNKKNKQNICWHRSYLIVATLVACPGGVVPYLERGVKCEIPFWCDLETL